MLIQSGVCYSSGNLYTVITPRCDSVILDSLHILIQGSSTYNMKLREKVVYMCVQCAIAVYVFGIWVPLTCEAYGGGVLM